MQGLLARLRSVQAESSESREHGKAYCEDASINQKTPQVNKLNNHALASSLQNTSDGQVIPELNFNGDSICVGGLKDTDKYSQLNSCHTEDGFAIDVVMATNSGSSKAQPRSRKQRASSPREAMKGPRKTARSRISLNSTSERDDVSLCADSDEETLTSRSGQVGNNGMSNAAQAWAAFEDAVKNIDNSSPEYFTKKPKPNFESSGTFQKVMVDMYGNTEYGNTKGYTLLKLKLNHMAKATTLASRMMASAVTRGQQEREREAEEGTDEEPEEEPQVEQNSTSKLFAKRGWKILKRQVQDTAMEHKCQPTKLNWAMLQHTVKQMTNVDRTRQDLYERYGILPTRLDDGSVVCQNRMLSEKARSQLYNDSHEKSDNHHLISINKRPSSYQPPPVHLRSISQLSFQKKGRDSLKNSKLGSSGSKRFRPKTAK